MNALHRHNYYKAIRGSTASSPLSGGFTLPEVLMGLAITALIAAAVSAMVYTVSYGTSSQRDMQMVLVENDVVGLRISSLVRPAKMVLAQGNSYLVLWMRDVDNNNTPKLSELCRIEYVSSTKTLTKYMAPAGLASGSDTVYALASTDFNAVTSSLKGTSSFPATVLGSDITALTFLVNNANVQQCSYVGYNITSTINTTTSTMVGGSAMLNR